MLTNLFCASLCQPNFLDFPGSLSRFFSFSHITFNFYKYLVPWLGLSQHSLQPSSWVYRPQAPVLRNYLRLVQMDFNWSEISFSSVIKDLK